MTTSLGSSSYADVIERDGFTVVKDALDEDVLANMSASARKRAEAMFSMYPSVPASCPAKNTRESRRAAMVGSRTVGASMYVFR